MSWAFGFWVVLANTLTDGLSQTAATNRHLQTDPWECKPAGIISAEVGRELINGSACLQSFQGGIEGVCVCVCVCVSVCVFVCGVCVAVLGF